MLSEFQDQKFETNNQGAWAAQLVKHPTLAEVIISQFVRGPVSDFLLSTQSSLHILSSSLSLSLSPSLSHSCSFSAFLRNKKNPLK